MHTFYFIIEQTKKLPDSVVRKALGICLTISMALSIFLAGYSIAYEPKCEREHLEVIDRKYDCVPREDLAKGIAGAAIGLEDNWETQEEFFYIVECTYNKERYEWIVIFTPRDEHTGEKKVVGIRKDIGLISIYQ